MQEKMHKETARDIPQLVTDDVTWPWKVKVMTPTCLGLNISKTSGDAIYSATVANYYR